MSDQVQSRPANAHGDEAPLTKSEKRALAKVAKAKAAAAKRRRQALSGVLAGLAVVAVIVIAFIALDNSGEDDSAESTAGNPGASAPADPAAPPADPAAPPANAQFPPLPDGADPALAQKPTATKGTGEVTKLTPTTLIEGTGPAAQAGQQITVNYVGVTYADGTEFDSSWSRSEPFAFQLGGGQVIPGWDQGLVGAKVGSRIQLDIPAALAYGENPGNGAPGGTLRFVVDVLGVQ
ncbi:FKBP-type peptidyl-prolyl cis-trans isomerase [Micromonospora sp. NPDC050397]|uniref:FKBP-type peptidyl-prolyl cis-trans isomerase n=1 Tax=Micromonospora sp. NPDC050397 TaxID=3364279 RepID=UPI00384B47E3